VYIIRTNGGIHMLDITTDNTRYPFPPLSDKLNFRVGERRCGWYNERTGTWEPNNDKKVIVREIAGGGRPLATVGCNYKRLDNSELFPGIEQYIIDTIDDKYLTRVTVKEHVAHGGRDCWREYIFHDLTCPNHDQVAFRLIVGNSYGGMSVKMMAGSIDFFCTNGTVLGSFDRHARRHTSGLSVTGLTQWVQGALDEFVAYGARIEKYDNMPIDLTKEDGLFEHLVKKGVISAQRARVIQPAMHKERNTRAGRDTRPNMWHLYSALTDWATHAEVRDTGNDHKANTVFHRQQSVERVIREAAAYVTA
jgi:hypothetical protein